MWIYPLSGQDLHNILHRHLLSYHFCLAMWATQFIARYTLLTAIWSLLFPLLKRGLWSSLLLRAVSAHHFYCRTPILYNLSLPLPSLFIFSSSLYSHLSSKLNFKHGWSEAARMGFLDICDRVQSLRGSQSIIPLRSSTFWQCIHYWTTPRPFSASSFEWQACDWFSR